MRRAMTVPAPPAATFLKDPGGLRRMEGMIPRFLLLLPFFALAAVAGAEEDDMEQSWPSPDGRYVIHHTATYDHREIPRETPEETYDQGAAYTLTRRGRLLWGAAASVDESAHSFRCLWAADSRAALILDRRARGDVEMWLVLPARASASRGRRLHVQRLIDRVEARAGDDNWRELQKAWFGHWRYAHHRFEGILIATRSRYYLLRLRVNPAAPEPRLQLVGSKLQEKWDDALEAL